MHDSVLINVVFVLIYLNLKIKKTCDNIIHKETAV